MNRWTDPCTCVTILSITYNSNSHHFLTNKLLTFIMLGQLTNGEPPTTHKNSVFQTANFFFNSYFQHSMYTVNLYNVISTCLRFHQISVLLQDGSICSRPFVLHNLHNVAHYFQKSMADSICTYASCSVCTCVAFVFQHSFTVHYSPTRINHHTIIFKEEVDISVEFSLSSFSQHKQYTTSIIDVLMDRFKLCRVQNNNHMKMLIHLCISQLKKVYSMTL